LKLVRALTDTVLAAPELPARRTWFGAACELAPRTACCAHPWRSNSARLASPNQALRAACPNRPPQLKRPRRSIQYDQRFDHR
ncbi:hypothetical protein, partial [Paralcaligenes ureilyticus]|uniref:hypothetical protein n=1 Tax=Paralcaligenes ureilyticus TaxID=627131 RepID=UPI001A9EE590